MLPRSSQNNLRPVRRSDGSGEFLLQTPAEEHHVFRCLTEFFFAFQTLSECSVTIKMIHLKRVRTVDLVAGGFLVVDIWKNSCHNFCDVPF